MDPRSRELIESNLNELIRVTTWNRNLEDFLAKNPKLKKVSEAVQVGLKETPGINPMNGLQACFFKRVFFKSLVGTSGIEYTHTSLRF